MRYNVYKATEGKVLLDLNDFNYAQEMCFLNDLDVVEMTMEEAQYYHSKYQEGLIEQETVEPEVEEPVEEVIEEQPILLKGTKGLRTAVVEPADPVQRLKNFLKEEMVFKGHDLNNLVKPIIHELK